MAPVSPDLRGMPTDDELDAILNGTENTNASAAEPPKGPQRRKTNDAGAGLGIDEEIKVVKQRQPIPKLDEDRLLSDAGISRLRRISKDRLRFKGKGHEYSDITRMLNMYQLWLDDLYPRAKFADGLAMIEKLGHSKRMQSMRKDWIDEGKPRDTTERDDSVNEDARADVPIETREQDVGAMEGVQTEENDQLETRQPSQDAPIQNNSTENIAENDGPDEDELDALLAEAESDGPAQQAPFAPSKDATADDDDPFADDMEAIAGLDW